VLWKGNNATALPQGLISTIKHHRKPNSTAQQQELTTFCDIIELNKVLCDATKHIFRLFRHVTTHT